jgi:short-subunit dehydrogenase
MLSEKVAVITGGSSGIGFSIATKFAEHGVNLVLISRIESSLNAAKLKLLDYPINIYCVSGDLSKVENIPSIVDSVLLLTSRIDFFINNAGLAKFASVGEYTTENFDSLFDFNVKVPFLMIKSFLPGLIQHKGAIVNISTYWSHKMVKAGILRFILPAGAPWYLWLKH